ncbi:uncharacterized protein LOC112569213 [Pomacea canaliculata]|uniref:uncharacterized protein LOC112569213 n=1 Tax=Pomacea canaliculata TaxID=400727 RepID=UPI000D728151|nr:uncharacterized protein LOC112569213 [Pomacea canaliculata]
MYFIMNTSTKVGSLCLILLTLMKGIFLLECGFSSFTESLSKEENGSININYTINVMTSPDVPDRLYAHYTVCEGNSARTPCIFIYEKHFITEFKKEVSEETGVTCYWEQRHVSSSVVALDIYISQVVTRSLSAMIIYTGRDELPIPTRLIRVEVLYPPKVTSLTVGGEDFTGPYFINEGQKVYISCFFDKGNPPATFKLLDKHGQVLKSRRDERYLNRSLTAHCKDDWPTVRCEGSGSKQNRSVTFFVRCRYSNLLLSCRLSPTYYKVCFTCMDTRGLRNSVCANWSRNIITSEFQLYFCAHAFVCTLKCVCVCIYVCVCACV